MFRDMFLSFKRSIAECRVEYAETLITLAKLKLWKRKTKICRLECVLNILGKMTVLNWRLQCYSSEADNHLNKSIDKF